MAAKFAHHVKCIVGCGTLALDAVGANVQVSICIQMKMVCRKQFSQHDKRNNKYTLMPAYIITSIQLSMATHRDFVYVGARCMLIITYVPTIVAIGEWWVQGKPYLHGAHMAMEHFSSTFCLCFVGFLFIYGCVYCVRWLLCVRAPLLFIYPCIHFLRAQMR